MSRRDSKRMKTVFVSYSHDSARHSNAVRRLVDRLREVAGCDSRLDAYVDGTVAKWPKWMRLQIRDADFVLMIFTRIYRRRFDGEERGPEGRGVTWEGTIIQNTLYAAADPDGLKFIPVVLHTNDLRHVPRDVFSGTTYVLPRDWPRLIRHIKGGAIASRGGFSEKRPPLSKQRYSSSPRNVLPVLFVGAQKGTFLNLRGQLARTKEAIARAKFGKSVRIMGVFNLTLDNILMELNRLSPSILHLSGKQEGGQIKLHNERGQLAPLSADHLATLLSDYSTMLRMVILDTCDSLPQARTIAHTIDFAVGVRRAIAEPVAIDFFAMFYNAIASGYPVQRAYEVAFGLELAKIEGNTKYRREIEGIIECKFSPNLHLPQLAVRRGIDARKTILVK